MSSLDDLTGSLDEMRAELETTGQRVDRLADEFARKTAAHRRNTLWLWITLGAIVAGTALVIGLLAWSTVATNRQVERAIAESQTRITASEHKLCAVVILLQPTPNDPPPRDERARRIRDAFAGLVHSYGCVPAKPAGD